MFCLLGEIAITAFADISAISVFTIIALVISVGTVFRAAVREVHSSAELVTTLVLTLFFVLHLFYSCGISLLLSLPFFKGWALERLGLVCFLWVLTSLAIADIVAMPLIAIITVIAANFACTGLAVFEQKLGIHRTAFLRSLHVDCRDDNNQKTPK